MPKPHTTPGYSLRTNDTGSHFIDLHPASMDQIRRQAADALARDTEGKARQAMIELGWMPPEISHEAIRLLLRYRLETPLGNQPHMIAHEVDEFILAVRPKID